MDMNRKRLLAEITTDEGLRLKPYKCTAGKLTIGIGRNLDDRGITEAEAAILADNDIDLCMAELDRNAPWWREMTDARQRALTNMCFNLGWPRLSKFKNMLSALRSGDYDKAAIEALDSRWAQQVGVRSERIADMFRQG